MAKRQQQQEQKVRVAQIQLRFVNETTRAGDIIFGEVEEIDNTQCAAHASCGYTFFLQSKSKQTDKGVWQYYGGFVSPVRLNKESEYPPAQFYIYVTPYKGENENIAYTVNLTAYEAGAGDDDGQFGGRCASGILYKGNLPGYCNGWLFDVDPEEVSKSKSPSSRAKSSGNKSMATDTIPW